MPYNRELYAVASLRIDSTANPSSFQALARAVYSGAPIVALDDPISAQTKDVGDEIISRLLGPQGVLRSSTVVIATSKPCKSLSLFYPVYYVRPLC